MSAADDDKYLEALYWAVRVWGRVEWARVDIPPVGALVAETSRLKWTGESVRSMVGRVVSATSIVGDTRVVIRTLAGDEVAWCNASWTVLPEPPQ